MQLFVEIAEVVKALQRFAVSRFTACIDEKSNRKYGWLGGYISLINFYHFFGF